MYIPSRSSPKPGGNRACLCKNGKYSRKCCDGSLAAQGIGNVYGVKILDNDLITENEKLILTENNLNIKI